MAADPFSVLGVGPDASLDELRAARRRKALEVHPDRGGDGQAMREVNLAFSAAVHAVRSRPHRRPTPDRSRVERDQPSFVIELLPAEAFEALLVVTSWIGEVLVDDPPYLLEVEIRDPASCWCRLELMPDAGSSTVSLTVEGPLGAEQVRDLWIDQLNQLGRWDPER